MTTTYKYVGRHVDDLADGRVLVPGRTVELDDAAIADAHNAQRINDGLLITAQDESEISATDEARDLATANDVDLRDVQGTGKDGRILKSDVETYIQKKEGND